jgi:hypothetical protein
MNSEERVGFRSHSTSLARNLFLGPNSTAAPPRFSTKSIDGAEGMRCQPAPSGVCLVTSRVMHFVLKIPDAKTGQSSP